MTNTMTLQEQRDALLDALKNCIGVNDPHRAIYTQRANGLIAAIESAKAEEVQQEPVARVGDTYVAPTSDGEFRADLYSKVRLNRGDLLYTSPQPLRELSEDEIFEVLDAFDYIGKEWTFHGAKYFTRAILAAARRPK